jgi:hypothetical protein
MNNPIERCRIEGTVPPWSVTSVHNFVVGALNRAQRDAWALPGQFRLSICPWGERNILGGTPTQVQEVINPRLRLVHFTGCGRPYLLILFVGEDAAAHQQIAMQYLPWSEHFSVTCHDNEAALDYHGSTEEINDASSGDVRTLRELLGQGALADF